MREDGAKHRGRVYLLAITWRCRPHNQLAWEKLQANSISLPKHRDHHRGQIKKIWEISQENSKDLSRT